MAGSKPGRVNHRWKGPDARPETHLFLCMLEHLKRKLGSNQRVLERFKRLVPEYAVFFPGGVSDASIIGRIDTQARGDECLSRGQKSYAHEQPELNKHTQPYWVMAGRLVQLGVRLVRRLFRLLPCLLQFRMILGQGRIVWKRLFLIGRVVMLSSAGGRTLRMLREFGLVFRI